MQHKVLSNIFAWRTVALKNTATRTFARRAPRLVGKPPISPLVKGSREHSAAEADGKIGLVETAWKLARLQTAVPDGAWETFEERAIQGCHALRGDEIVRLLHAFTMARRRPKRLLALLADEILEKLPQLDANALCVCLHTYSQMREREQRLFSLIARRVLAEDKVSELKPSHLASLLYSHARAVLSDQTLNRTMQSRLAHEANTLSVDDLATTLQAFVTFRLQEHGALNACVKLTVDHARDGASLESLSTILYALNRLDTPCAELSRTLALRCETEGFEALRTLTVVSLVHLLHGFGEVKWADKACRIIVDSLGGRLEELAGPKLLLQTLEAFARALQTGPVLPELNKCIASKMVDFSIKDVTAAAHACLRLGPACDGVILEALARQASRKGERFSLRRAQVIFDACDAAGFRHPAIEELKKSCVARQIEAEEEAHRRSKEVRRENDEAIERQEARMEGKYEALEDQPFFQEQRLTSQDVAAVASAAKAWGTGRRRHQHNKQQDEGHKQRENMSSKDEGFQHRDGPQQPGHPTIGRFQAVRKDEAPPSPQPLRKRPDDPAMLQLLKGFDRDVLRPAGLQSDGLDDAGSPNRRRRSNRSRSS